MEITELRDAFFENMEGQSDEWKAGAMAALKMVLETSGNFGGDAVDFYEWLEEKVKENK